MIGKQNGSGCNLRQRQRQFPRKVADQLLPGEHGRECLNCQRLADGTVVAVHRGVALLTLWPAIMRRMIVMVVVATGMADGMDGPGIAATMLAVRVVEVHHRTGEH